MTETPVTILWFRNDLRLDDHPALAAACRGRVVPLFIWAPEEESPWEPGAVSRWWLHHSLERLSAALEKAGAPLVVRRGPSLDALRAVAREVAATHVAWNRRYEPAVVKRDTAIKKALVADGFVAESFNGALLFEPVHVATKEGKPYQVFTPFWRSLLARPEPAEPVAAPKKLLAASTTSGKPLKSLSLGELDLLPTTPWDNTMRKTWSPGEAGATKRLTAFLETRLSGYGTERDRPDHDGTSTLSPSLHFGEISPRRVWHAVRHAAGDRPVAKLTGDAEVFLRELGWREFASHLLYHFPHTTDAPLRSDYARFPWAKDPVGLRAWQRGRTGYPIVDAGMRQLWATGWMHNRVRMIVASFLVKDLRISWLEGARWFWDTLVDADLAANTLGWQWAAGCGADAAPYFRIFNPTTQGEKFDPDGDYVRTWVRDLGRNYPEPIVDHAEARKLALEALKKVTGR
jgi:deoxyribodipyrimidine photo-lyase